MNIRKVAPEDNKILAKIIRQVFEEHSAPTVGTVYSDPTTDHLFNLFKADKSILLVAEFEGNVVGCCGIYPTPGLPSGYVELVKFYLHANARGRGIGKALMEGCIDAARKLGYTHVYIESLPEFAKAVDIYKKLGFEYLDVPLGNSGHTGCNIWMVKSII
jgi:putative acetyltransferase